jgi:phytoene dehydrogenase-like protein
MENTKTDVIIIGAGLAGLCCARHLHRKGVRCSILESSDGVGGRIRTDIVDGYKLDRGFQVFLTSYPEAKAVLDYDSLQLRPFLPDALVRYAGRFYELSDPWRRPVAALKSLASPIGSFADKCRVAKFRWRTLAGTIEDRFQDPETTALQSLRDAGFSSSMIDRFFRPFLGGIFLDEQLETSSRMLSFVFRMFSLGDACLPAEGMEAIPKQLADSLPSDCVRLNTQVMRVQAGQVTLSTGENLSANSIVVATDVQGAARLLGDTISPATQSTTCFYFAAPRPPIKKPILLLNGDGTGPINNLCIPTQAAPSYGPDGKSLVSVTTLKHSHPENAESLLKETTEQLATWFGPDVHQWRHLRTYRIPNALPAQRPPALQVPQRPVRWSSGIYVCGDHRDNASIQGAMVSGRRAAEAIVQDIA